jgi:hypothetical protein
LGRLAGPWRKDFAVPTLWYGKVLFVMENLHSAMFMSFRHTLQ